MSGRLEYVEIIFENCETAKMDAEDISYVALYDIAENISISANREGNCKWENAGHYKTANLCLVLLKSADKHMDGLVYDVTLFERIQMCDDITHIKLYFDDYMQEYAVYYKGNENSVWQTSRKTEKGMEIRIEKGEEAITDEDEQGGPEVKLLQQNGIEPDK